MLTIFIIKVIVLISLMMVIAAVGVSGGPDSVALCVLTSQWKKDALIGIDEKDGCVDGLLAIVVDHGLRKESKDEANVVHDRVSKLGIAFNLF